MCTRVVSRSRLGYQRRCREQQRLRRTRSPCSRHMHGFPGPSLCRHELALRPCALLSFAPSPGAQQQPWWSRSSGRSPDGAVRRADRGAVPFRRPCRGRGPRRLSRAVGGVCDVDKGAVAPRPAAASHPSSELLRSQRTANCCHSTLPATVTGATAATGPTTVTAANAWRGTRGDSQAHAHPGQAAV